MPIGEINLHRKIHPKEEVIKQHQTKLKHEKRMFSARVQVKSY